MAGEGGFVGGEVGGLTRQPVHLILQLPILPPEHLYLLFVLRLVPNALIQYHQGGLHPLVLQYNIRHILAFLDLESGGGSLNGFSGLGEADLFVSHRIRDLVAYFLP